MQKIMKTFAVIGIASLTLVGCKKTDNQAVQSEISQETMGQIKALGFSTAGAVKVDEGYMVEGDIILTPENLTTASTSPNLIIAGVEQYRTTNVVGSLPRVITISTSSSVGTALSNSVNNMIARYNAENLGLTFQRVTTGGQINIRIVNTGQYIASAGFPSGGNPYPEVKYAKTYSNYSDGFMTTVLAHEVGHCIGFRHTDYMDRSYSCGGTTSNEGQSTSGAVHIPGTPTGADPASWRQPVKVLLPGIFFLRVTVTSLYLQGP